LKLYKKRNEKLFIFQIRLKERMQLHPLFFHIGLILSSSQTRTYVLYYLSPIPPTKQGETEMSEHPIVHVEFSANDREAAGKFFSDVFGWEIQQMPEMNYAMYSTGDGVGGGLNPVSDTNPAGTTLVHIGTKEVCKNKIPFLKWSGRIGRQKG